MRAQPSLTTLVFGAQIEGLHILDARPRFLGVYIYLEALLGFASGAMKCEWIFFFSRMSLEGRSWKKVHSVFMRGEGLALPTHR